MDSGEGPFQTMLASLRSTYNARLPAGLTPSADARLQRTLNHYIREVLRVQGSFNEQEILRETFDSMAGWFRRNTDQILPGTATPPAVFKPIARHVIAMSAAAPAGGSPATATATSTPLETDDPIALFERLKAARAGAAPFLPPEPSPAGIPELRAIDTRPPPPVEGVLGSGATGATAFGSTPLSALLGVETRIAPQPKDFIIRQEDVVKYREMEYNLVLNSKDRDWLNATAENRYQFTVQLNGGFIPQGTGIQPTIQNRLRNIVRIEFIKAILPVEGLDVVVPRTGCTESNTTPTPESAFVSSLALPYIQVQMDELQGNNTVGTNETVDRSLAICQYDATWKSDPTHVTTTNRGYTLFFPKLMKAQRVYTPTPLANLQSLSFHLLNPENLPLSTVPDSFGVNRVVYSHLSDTSGSCYSDASGGTAATAQYLFIETKKWFPLWAFSRLDRVTFDGLTFTSTTPAIQAAGETLNEWLERPEGHVIVGIASSVSDGVQDSANSCGYANWIIVRNRFQDPTAGGCERYLFAGANESGLADQIAAYNAETGYQRGGVLNLSRQVQLFLRVITREVDPASNLRPDNV
jgi:hypothetical protein